MGTYYNRIDEAVLMSTHNLCFGAKIRNNRHTPAYPKFHYINVEFKGVFIARTCFPDGIENFKRTYIRGIFNRCDFVVFTNWIIIVWVFVGKARTSHHVFYRRKQNTKGITCIRKLGSTAFPNSPLNKVPKSLISFVDFANYTQRISNMTTRC